MVIDSSIISGEAVLIVYEIVSNIKITLIITLICETPKQATKGQSI